MKCEMQHDCGGELGIRLNTSLPNCTAVPTPTVRLVMLLGAVTHTFRYCCFTHRTTLVRVRMHFLGCHHAADLLLHLQACQHFRAAI